MRRNLFWLSDEQWWQIAPHLPKDVRGKERRLVLVRRDEMSCLDRRRKTRAASSSSGPIWSMFAFITWIPRVIADSRLARMRTIIEP